jgi:hypothetical protein
MIGGAFVCSNQWQGKAKEISSFGGARGVCIFVLLLLLLLRFLLFAVTIELPVIIVWCGGIHGWTSHFIPLRFCDGMNGLGSNSDLPLFRFVALSYAWAGLSSCVEGGGVLGAVC